MPKITLPAFPAPLEPLGDWGHVDGVLTVEAGPGTDHFVPPTGEVGTTSSATLLTEAPHGDFILSARVEVDFAADFDAGALFLQTAGTQWAKLCYEAVPGGGAALVSVVTRDRSDDATGFLLDGPGAYLRISRIGPAYAFHGSADGHEWVFLRFFHLEAGGAPRIGFAAQSPTGQGCRVSFSEVHFARRTLGDLRGGS